MPIKNPSSPRKQRPSIRKSFRIITVAFEEAWELLTQADSTLAKRRPAATRERLAKRIIELARHGERDPRRLRDSAMLFITQSSLKSLPRRPRTGMRLVCGLLSTG